MIIDNYLTLSGAWAAGVWTPQLVTATGNTLSTNVIDLAATKQAQAADFGQGEPLECEISIVNSITSAGAATVQFQLVTADDAAITVNPTIVVQTDAIPKASLLAGVVVPLHLDRAAPYVPRRYLALRYVVGTAVLTNGTGQFIANLVKSLQDVGNSTIFQSGFVIA